MAIENEAQADQPREASGKFPQAEGELVPDLPAKRGRKPIDVNPDHVRAMAAIWCTKREIATVLGMSVDTLDRRFRKEFKKGRAEGRTNLRRKMWSTAESGNVSMQIFLSKQMLGYRDSPEPRPPVPSGKGAAQAIDWTKLSNDERDALRQILTRAKCPDCRPERSCAQHGGKAIATSPRPQLEHNA
jgi:hypothetical protein